MRHTTLWVAAALLGFTLLPLAANAQTKATIRGPRPPVLQQRIGIQAQSEPLGDLDAFSTVHALVKIVDDGTTLSVTGRGAGFDANGQFISLFYDNGSVSRGALACLPTSTQISPAQMFVGYWVPIGSTSRVISASPTSYQPVLKTAGSPYPYVSLNLVGTMSIRYDSTPNVRNPLMNLGPGRYYLQACGNA